MPKGNTAGGCKWLSSCMERHLLQGPQKKQTKQEPSKSPLENLITDEVDKRVAANSKSDFACRKLDALRTRVGGSSKRIQ